MRVGARLKRGHQDGLEHAIRVPLYEQVPAQGDLPLEITQAADESGGFELGHEPGEHAIVHRLWADVAQACPPGKSGKAGLHALRHAGKELFPGRVDRQASGLEHGYQARHVDSGGEVAAQIGLALRRDLSLDWH